MRKQEGVVRLALNHNFERALRKALEPIKPIFVPTNDADRMAIDQRGHDLFRQAKIKESK